MNDPTSHQETLHFWRSQIARMKKFVGKLLNGKPEEVAWNEVALCAEMERNLNDAINEIDRLTRRLYEMTAMRDALTVACGDKVGEIERLQALLNARQPYYCHNCSCPQRGNTRPAHKTIAHHCIDCIELKNALAAAVKVANEARECHDRDQDMRTMKLLIALSGHLPKWRADTDRIHDVLRRAVERLSDPVAL